MSIAQAEGPRRPDQEPEPSCVADSLGFWAYTHPGDGATIALTHHNSASCSCTVRIVMAYSCPSDPCWADASLSSLVDYYKASTDWCDVPRVRTVEIPAQR